MRRQVRAVLPELFADLDAIFISHGHHDHLDPPSLRRIPGKPTVIVPRGFGRMAAKLDLGPVEVEPGDIRDRPRRFEVTHAEHSGRREPLGPSGPAVGCVLAGSKTVYFPGDTDLFPGMGELIGRLDVAMLPVWGWGPTIGEGHMYPVRAAAATAILRPGLDPDPPGHLLPGRHPAGRAGAVRRPGTRVRVGPGRLRARRAGPGAGSRGGVRPRWLLNAADPAARAGSRAWE